LEIDDWRLLIEKKSFSGRFSAWTLESTGILTLAEGWRLKAHAFCKSAIINRQS